jgi:hypothetical protein
VSQPTVETQQSSVGCPVAFLGLADAINYSQLPYPIGPLDLYRLSKFRNCLVIPNPLIGLKVVLLINSTEVYSRKVEWIRVAFCRPNSTELFNIRIEFQPVAATPAAEIPHEPLTAPSLLRATGAEWHFFVGSCPDSLVLDPGAHEIRASTNLRDYGVIDRFGFGYSKAPPLTAEEIAASESNILANKKVKLALSCKLCNSNYFAYTGFERDKELESSKCVWQEDLPDTFACECGKSQIDLTRWRESLHALLRIPDISESSTLSLERRYTIAHLKEVSDAYAALIAKDVPEEQVQKFIENNKALLSVLRPARTFIKPKIVGDYLADFATLDYRGVLTLIELERPSLKLFTKKGDPSAGLSHAFGQVRNWMVLIQQHRQAFLHTLNLQESDVTAVKGLVLAGRLSKEIHEPLKKHRMVPLSDQIEFHTLEYLSVEMNELAKALA